VKPKRRVGIVDFLALVHWLDGSPILPRVEPYRRQILTDVLDSQQPDGAVRFNLALLGRAKKNAKSLDLVLAALFACLANDSPQGNDCFVVATDEGQARDDLTLAKRLVAASPHLAARLHVREKSLVRRDGRGHVTILPGQDVAGSHGKTYRFTGLDEIHTQRDWALLEAMQLDPHRPDAQLWITSYASIHHRLGIPLYDLLAQGKRGDDPRMYFSWYGADFSTDPAAAALDPEARANPSLASFAPGYLQQQQRRLPSHVYRRLHLNLPGLPAGAAFTAEAVADAITRGIRVRPPQDGVAYVGFVDPSGGSNDAMTLGIAHLDGDGRAVVDGVWNQGAATPFNPRTCVGRFAGILKSYRVAGVFGDRYAGLTFVEDFRGYGLAYEPSAASASDLYAAFEPKLNAGLVALPDDAAVEQELLGLIWKANKITHPANEHDDHANAAVGACLVAFEVGAGVVDTGPSDVEQAALDRWGRGDVDWRIPVEEYGGRWS
jgi:hypothetical protein